MSYAVPVDPDRTTVVVVDMQNDYVHDDGGLVTELGYDPTGMQAAADRMAAFLDEWRDRGLDVVHVRTHQSPATNSAVWNNRYRDREVSICEPGSWGAAFYAGLEPSGDEPVVTKHRYSGFEGTNLDLILRSNDVRTLAVCGALTHVCVEATARDGFHRDYHLVFPENCCTTTDGYRDLHRATLENMDQFYGEVTSSDALLDHVDAERETGRAAAEADGGR